MVDVCSICIILHISTMVIDESYLVHKIFLAVFMTIVIKMWLRGTGSEANTIVLFVVIVCSLIVVDYWSKVITCQLSINAPASHGTQHPPAHPDNHQPTNYEDNEFQSGGMLDGVTPNYFDGSDLIDKK